MQRRVLQKTKVDWRGCVAGTWRKVATKGPCPLPLHSASVTYYNGKVGGFALCLCGVSVCPCMNV